ncbi:hypothetical protein C8Q73DRAFT_791703 [Cubamyces lactineus]|nr:hypothetical protein C8Q73DRAFT_791703 [Cubamyces lactineus]
MQSGSIQPQAEAVTAHYALGNPDILDEIFWHLDPYPEVEGYTRAGVLDAYFPRGGSATRRASPNVRTLASAALACKAFAEPASSVLWASLPKGLRPLLYPLRGYGGAKVWDEDTQDLGSGGIEEKTNKIPANVWDRWEHCARRVRLVAIRDLNADWAQLSSLIPMSSYIRPANRPLLPNLRTIVLGSAGEGSSSAQLLQALVASSMIRTVSICTVNVIRRQEFASAALEDALSSDLDILARSSSASQLRHLLITSPLPFRLVYANSLRHVKAFRRLQTLHVGFVALDEHLDLLADLAALEALEGLTLRSRQVLDPVDNAQSSWNLESVVPSDSSSLSAMAGFPALRRILLEDEPQRIIHTLRLIRSRTLESVWLTSTQSATTAFPPMLTSLTSRHNIAASLRDLRLTYSIGWDQSSSETLRAGSTALLYAPLGDIVGPLTELHALETLWLNVGGKLIRMSDGDVAAMGNAWPRLRSLVIDLPTARTLPQELQMLLIAYEVNSDESPSYTLSSLVRLATNCRSLRHVDISTRPHDVSEEELVVIEELATGGSRAAASHDPQTEMRYLLPLSSDQHQWFEISFADVHRLARALRRLFPRLGRPERQIEQESLMRQLSEWEKEDMQSGFLELLQELTVI